MKTEEFAGNLLVIEPLQLQHLELQRLAGQVGSGGLQLGPEERAAFLRLGEMFRAAREDGFRPGNRYSRQPPEVLIIS